MEESPKIRVFLIFLLITNLILFFPGIINYIMTIHHKKGQVTNICASLLWLEYKK